MQNSHNQNATLSEGFRQIAKGNYRTLHARSIELIKKNVEDPVPYFLLGMIAIDHRNVAKAVSLFERAIQFDNSSALYYAHLGRALTLLNDQVKAREAAEAASARPIEDAHVADTAGVVFSRTGFHEKAIPLFERAVALDNRPANFHYNLASSRQFIGDFDGARSAYLATLEREPTHFRAWSSLISLSKQTEANEKTAELERLFERHQGQADAQLHFGHALAKTLEDLGEFEQSLTWLHRAKELKRSSLGYKVENDLALFDAAEETTRLSDPQQTVDVDDAPIFIVGLPRTGTTLVDRIISSHPDVTSAGELNTFAGLIKRASGTSSNLVLDPETLRASSGINLSKIGASYVQQTAALARGAGRFTDKMPLNFFYAGLIHRALPNARIIALRRGALDSCLSNYRQLFSTGFSYYNYTFDLEDTAAYYKAFDRLMIHWRKKLPADRFTEVHYENIVYEQEEETRRLLSFCCLDWNEACLRFHENEAPVSTASSVQVRQPLYSGSIGRWKRYGDTFDALKVSLGELAT